MDGSRGRWSIEHPPIPLDCVYDACQDPESHSGITVPIGHGKAFCDGAEYEQERIIEILAGLGVTCTLDTIIEAIERRQA